MVDTHLNSEIWHIEVLAKAHNRNVFDCGVDEMNIYLRQSANQHARRDLSRTFVLIPGSDPSRIVGYYTLTLGELAVEQLPKERHLPHYPIPVAKIARLAVDVECQGRGFGKGLLFHAFRKCQNIADEGGCYAVILDALDAEKASFYARQGFMAMNDDNPLTMYISMQDVRALKLRPAESA